jgi:hypothetical protein
LALVLAIEPDAKQAAILKRVVRERAHAEITVVDSKDAAIAAINAHAPDLILVTALLSPRDEEELVAHLRTLGDESDHLQTITIPLLAPALGGGDDEDGFFSKAFGGKKKKRKDNSSTVGCDPWTFADQVNGYLKAATEARVARQAQLEFAARHKKDDPEVVPTAIPEPEMAAASIPEPEPEYSAAESIPALEPAYVSSEPVYVTPEEPVFQSAEPTVIEPEPAWAAEILQPHAVAEPEAAEPLVFALPEPIAAEPEPEPVAFTPEPIVLPEPEPLVLPEPEPVASPNPVVAAPAEPVYETSPERVFEPVVEEPPKKKAKAKKSKPAQPASRVDAPRPAPKIELVRPPEPEPEPEPEIVAAPVLVQFKPLKRLPPLAMWARTEELIPQPEPSPAQTKSEDDISDLFASLRVPSHVLPVTYPHRPYLRRVRAA